MFSAVTLHIVTEVNRVDQGKGNVFEVGWLIVFGPLFNFDIGHRGSLRLPLGNTIEDKVVKQKAQFGNFNISEIIIAALFAV